MKRRAIAWIAALTLLVCCLSAGAEAEGQLSGLMEAGKKLLLETDNVTMEGYAEFSLDGEKPFKKAEATYVQDGTSSLWRLRLLTPRYFGEQVTGFTVIANGRKVYVMEDYHPGLYRMGDDAEQQSVIRKSPALEQLLALGKVLAPGLEAALGTAVSGEDDGRTTVIQLKQGDIPEAVNSLANLGAQFLVRRLFGLDYDRMSGYEEAYLEDFAAVSSALLACTTHFTLTEVNLRAVQDEQGRLILATGSLKADRETRNDGIHSLSIGFSGEAGKYGESEVKDFDPEDYGVTLMEDAYFPPAELSVRSLLEGWEPAPRSGESVELPLTPAALSERYQRIRKAQEALEARYGLRQEMLTFFSRSVKEDSDGLTLSYTGMNDFCTALGTYTAKVTAEGVETSWSHDGENADSAEFDAPVWGIGQLEKMLEIAKRDREVISFYNQAAEIARKADPAYEMPFDPLFVFNESWMEGDEIRERCRYAVGELTEIGRQAIGLVYGLSDQEQGKLIADTDLPENHFMRQGDRLIYQAWFSLTQAPYPAWTERDGLYEVLIDAESGQIEDIIYDSGLNGNG